MTQSSSTFELHERVLVDLERRDSTVREKEREARRLLEQALAQCGTERTAIANERAVLAQAEQLYRRFLGTGVAIGADQPPPELTPPQAEQPRPAEAVSDPELSAPAELSAEATEPAEPERGGAAPEGSDPASDIEARVRDLRSGLAVQVTLEEAAGQKPTKWTGPLRALLSPGS